MVRTTNNCQRTRFKMRKISHMKQHHKYNEYGRFIASAEYVLLESHGGVVVSVLATRSNGRRFKPSRGNGFLRAIKIRSTPSFGWEVKPEGPMS
jgi:hypothetical protein